jgi:hypothetical protein
MQVILTDCPTVMQVAIHEAQFVLHPGEVLTETLLLRPAAAGWLRVIGVAWTTNGALPGRAMFDIAGRKRKQPKGDR